MFFSSLALKGYLVFSLVSNNIFLSRVTQYKSKASHSLNEINLSVSVFLFWGFCVLSGGLFVVGGWSFFGFVFVCFAFPLYPVHLRTSSISKLPSFEKLEDRNTCLLVAYLFTTGQVL